MQSLEKRIAELEKGASMNEGPLTIVIRPLAPGHLDEELQELHDQNGSQRWTRQPGETEQELIDRASREVTCNRPGCALLMAGNRLPRGA